MPTNMVKGFNVNDSIVQYDYESLADRILKSSIGEIYSSSSTYKIDDYVLYAGQLYRCIIEITTPQNFDSSKWEAVSAGADLKWLKKYYSINDEIKQALLNCFAHCAWVDEHGQDYYDALETALYRTADLDYITAVFNQGQNIIYDTDSLDTLRQYLVVTATYDDSSTGIVTGYTLSGTLTEGTSTITVSYGGKTATFDVTVTQLLPSGYTKVTALKATQANISANNASQYINLGFSANASKKYKIETAIKWAANQPVLAYNGYPSMLMSNALYIAVRNGYYMNFGYATESDIAPSTTSYDVISAEGNFVTLDYTFTINGETRTLNRGVAVSERQAYLFAQAPGSGQYIVSPCACSMKRTKIYVDDTLYMDLVPCLRNSDSVAGMYDRISETFLHSAGADEFEYEV
jgi:hypothetical protein